ncbi:ATP-binding cassette domain-containing protein [Cysteiniphilum sp. QT6929]|uniref:ABC transporter ATP-binding protein n=1 Tax=Cysteiniphilum sp. QT6929 TaxID=2975055 RepID=UPI0024B32A8B|nr:ATP-binding cassette domain-containing protein [Cysteiniphilum sp. QT6929]WHN65860.1 ATP-binding cassette domain-containing protein [Cysteiniphilum sp. QT6929]
MLELRNINIDARIFDMNTSFESGKKYAIIGVNGAGKTSLLDVISSKISGKSIAGKILLGGENIAKFNPKKRAQKFAYLAQNTQVLFNYTVNDIVSMGLYPHDLNPNRKENLINQVYEMLSLSKQKNMPFHTLSGGQKQRAHLARVVLQIIAGDNNEEKWLLLDEHAAGLDLYQQALVFEILDKLLKQHNLGVIMVMHDLNLAAQFCDQMLLIDSGRLLKMDETKKVILDDEFTKAFKIKAKYLADEDAFLFTATR